MQRDDWIMVLCIGVVVLVAVLIALAYLVRQEREADEWTVDEIRELRKKRKRPEDSSEVVS